MRQFTLIFFLLLTYSLSAQKETETPTIAKKTESLKAYDGFFKFYWDEKGGKIWLEIDKWDSEFLYINSLSAGIGSNDIGLDRNQLGNDRVVKFTRSGPKVLLVQPNYKFRAISDMAAERESVAEAFASSVIWGFKVEAATDNKVLIDITPLLLSDAHGVANRLKRNKQGTFKLDADRSAVYLDRTKNFPKNSEFEAVTTFTGDATGAYLRSVTPTPDAVTVRQHHSFVELPDDNYQPRTFDPRSGFIPTSYYDYATPIDQPLVKRFILRHRLKKKDPSAAVSEAVEPIVYYLDNGTPEPIRSALLDGARWWNQAYEAAGYKDAFQVKVLPEGADPMDVRYNMINWVHRSTRGWSYGSSVVDPRTGEIIKGHVLLGSLRVRQDFLIAQGLVEAYAKGENADPRLLEMALARLRQLSAHEVGHTIGLTHNFAASYNGRASVMDYPHPYITLDDQGDIDFSKAYDTKIGEWDKRMIIYGYQDFPEGADEAAELQKVIAENLRMGLKFIADNDARPAGGAHPVAHLWDNGQSAVEELSRLTAVREKALSRFSEKNIAPGAPMATLENVLVPLYLAHRYQVEGVAKVIGGVNYSYAVRDDGQPTNEMVADTEQRQAVDALLATLDPEFLTIPKSIIDLIPPQPMGYSRNRELFKTHTGLTFDPMAAAESSIDHTLSFLLQPQRLARVVEQYARDPQRMSLSDLLNSVMQYAYAPPNGSGMAKEIQRIVQKRILHHLLQLAGDQSINQQISAAALYNVFELEAEIQKLMERKSTPATNAHYTYLIHQISRFMEDPEDYKVPSAPSLPDGSPIGCGE